MASSYQGPAAQQLQQRAQVPQQRGGLKYILGRNGEAPKMLAIHCVFAKMAVEEMQTNMKTSGNALIHICNSRHAPAWSYKASKRKVHGRKAGNGLADLFFSNQLFKVADSDLRNTAMGISLYPVSLHMEFYHPPFWFFLCILAHGVDGFFCSSIFPVRKLVVECILAHGVLWLFSFEHVPSQNACC
jgi:hypothetical protein